ncbi:hypothetical protein EYC84_004083 [Monilinia fructicola]|uniref:Uncharacterized protein n=1 Tax=Monilinia fructicola TaxID=38448 RepID=A0A5M9K319_MONFR|nr:hypothetical protein EYC84_004083 [Monilinia fructicola]
MFIITPNPMCRNIRYLVNVLYIEGYHRSRVPSTHAPPPTHDSNLQQISHRTKNRRTNRRNPRGDSPTTATGRTSRARRTSTSRTLRRGRTRRRHRFALAICRGDHACTRGLPRTLARRCRLQTSLTTDLTNLHTQLTLDSTISLGRRNRTQARNVRQRVDAGVGGASSSYRTGVRGLRAEDGELNGEVRDLGVELGLLAGVGLGRELSGEDADGGVGCGGDGGRGCDGAIGG